MPDDQRRLLLLEPRRLDVVGDHVVLVAVDEHGGHTHGRAVVYPVVRAAGVPGEVRRAAQEQRAQPEPVHEIQEALPAGLAAG
jgi:hypothetical protein